jgi:hypothetical protein
MTTNLQKKRSAGFHAATDGPSFYSSLAVRAASPDLGSVCSLSLPFIFENWLSKWVLDVSSRECN